ncbi:MAG TPA: SRPBCC domain-containing protein [Polyangiaceae bacterium]|nr:SRPBCC domain-containing protein [Polyangiaceae bacterium]
MTDGKKAARAIADVVAGTILAEVEIRAPVERVYAALTRGDEIVKWWGSDDLYRTTEWTSELRPQGAWKATGVGADGSPFTVSGEYLVVEPPHRVTFTWKPEWEGGHVSTVTYRLEPIEGGTRLVLRHDGLTDRPDSCRGHTMGWERVLTWLVAHASTPSAPGAAPQARYVLARLVPPRPDFAMTMSPTERATMGEHVAYCRGLLEQGKAILFGPVVDGPAVWGCGLFTVADDAEARALTDADPVIKAGIGARYELLPFLNIMR